MPDPVVRVATDALRQEATVWANQADTIRGAQLKAETLRISGLEAGIFFIMVDDYTQLVNVVSGRCGEGVERMGEIAAALVQVADVYDAEEQGNVHRLTGLY